jgi:hypothetical protein
MSVPIILHDPKKLTVLFIRHRYLMRLVSSEITDKSNGRGTQRAKRRFFGLLFARVCKRELTKHEARLSVFDPLDLQ